MIDLFKQAGFTTFDIIHSWNQFVTWIVIKEG